MPHVFIVKHVDTERDFIVKILREVAFSRKELSIAFSRTELLEVKLLYLNTIPKKSNSQKLERHITRNVYLLFNILRVEFFVYIRFRKVVLYSKCFISNLDGKA